MAMAVRARAPAKAQARASGPVALLSKFSKLTSSGGKKANKGLLVDELLRLTRDCDAGFNTRPAERAQISSLVQELSAFCPKNPLSRPELLGRWEVRYASKPTTAGGPFKTLPGRIVFPGQVAIQEIQEPDIIINEINFKTLGFVPGSVTQVGTITPVSGSAFEIEFPNSTNRVGGPQKRTIELLYLDEEIRIARAIPREEGQEGSFYVFQREGMEFELDEEEKEEKEEGVKASRTRDQAVAAEGRAAAAARAKEEREAAAERARAEREALASRKAMAKELFADLSSAARESAVLAQSSAKELAELEREGAKMERDASKARRLIEKSGAVVQSLVERLEESQTDEAALEKELRASQRELSQVRVELAKTKKALSVK